METKPQRLKKEGSIGSKSSLLFIRWSGRLYWEGDYKGCFSREIEPIGNLKKKKKKAYEELVYVIIEAGKSKICRADVPVEAQKLEAALNLEDVSVQRLLGRILSYLEEGQPLF